MWFLTSQLSALQRSIPVRDQGKHAYEWLCTKKTLWCWMLTCGCDEWLFSLLVHLWILCWLVCKIVREEVKKTIPQSPRWSLQMWTVQNTKIKGYVMLVVEYFHSTILVTFTAVKNLNTSSIFVHKLIERDDSVLKEFKTVSFYRLIL